MAEWFARRRWLAAALAVAVVSTACGSDSDSSSTSKTTPAAQPSAQAAVPTAAATSAAGAAATAASQAPAVRAWTDDTGKSVAIAQVPKKVVALSPSVVETLYAVDAPPAARVSSATVPDAARSLPAVGSSYQVNLEQVAAQAPDLILADQQIQAPTLLAELGKIAPVFAMRFLTVDDVTKQLRVAGQIMGKAENGEKAAKRIEDKFAGINAKLPAQRPSTFIMIGDPNTFFAAKPNSFVGDVVKRLGGKNIVPDGPDTSPFPGFTSYSLEQLAATDPDVILVLSAGPPNAPKLSQGLASNPAWQSLKAVKAGRVHEIDPVTLVQSAGPRVEQQVDELAPLLYPGVFPPAGR